MIIKHLTVLFVLSSAISASASPNSSSFCASLQELPLKNMTKTEKIIQVIKTTRTSDYSQDKGRSPSDIEKTISPYKLSDDLKQEFQDKIADDDRDYRVFKSPDGSIFNFSTVEGSEGCAVDIWAKDKNGILEKSKFDPDLGDACDVVRIFGAYKGQNLLIQYSFAPSNKPAESSSLDKIDEIRVLKIRDTDKPDLCVINPK